MSAVATRHVYYSVTEDNPFLPSEYVEQLKRDLDPKMAERMLYGKWIEISREVIYHSYDSKRNFRAQDYKWDLAHPIIISHDFNIGMGKPMSACALQFKSDCFHFGQTFIVEGANTEEIMEEIAGSGILDLGCKIIVHGDAAGKNRDTRSKRSDYDIIRHYLANYRTPKGQAINFELQIRVSNPAIRLRHNTVNAYMHNAAGQTRLFVYKQAEDLDEGFKLTKLKSGGQNIEDDTFKFQHVTTAAGYAIVQQTVYAQKQSSTQAR